MDKEYKGLNLILDPVFVISKDYKILYQNKAAKEKFGDLIGEVCYKSILGFANPCWYFNNYKCPLKEKGKEKIITQILDLKEKDNKLTKFIGRIYFSRRRILETLLPYSDLIKQIGKHYTDISRDNY